LYAAKIAKEDDTVCKYTGADAYGDDVMAAVAFAREAVGVA
jgi:hypothetical protein